MLLEMEMVLSVVDRRDRERRQKLSERPESSDHFKTTLALCILFKVQNTIAANVQT